MGTDSTPPRRDAFGQLHPIIQFAFFGWVMAVNVLFLHPVMLAISLIASITWCVYLRGRNGLRSIVMMLLPLMLLAALFNPLFSHRGETALFYIEYNAVTLESIIYGLLSAGMLGAVICWFSSYNAIMTADRFLYVFGQLAPSISLIISMSLRLVSRYTAQIKRISDAQSCIGRDVGSGNIITRARSGLGILSIMITWALENGVESADSMVARGYGLKPRTNYHNFRFDERDTTMAALLAFSAVVVSIAIIGGLLTVQVYPIFVLNAFTPLTLAVYLLYAGVCFSPLMLDLKEDLTWRSISSRI